MATITNLEPVLSENQNTTNKKINELVNSNNTNTTDISGIKNDLSLTNQTKVVKDNFVGAGLIDASYYLTDHITDDHWTHFTFIGTLYKRSAGTEYSANFTFAGGRRIRRDNNFVFCYDNTFFDNAQTGVGMIDGQTDFKFGLTLSNFDNKIYLRFDNTSTEDVEFYFGVHIRHQLIF